MDEMVNGLEPPRKSALGRTRKVLSKLLLIFFLSALLVLAAGIFYGEKAEVFRLPLFSEAYENSTDALTDRNTEAQFSGPV